MSNLKHSCAALLSAAVALVLEPRAAGATSSIKDYPRISKRALESVVRISVVPADPLGRPIAGASKSGLGTRISSTGVILTAAHVCLPYEEEMRGADSYVLEIEDWDSQKRAWLRSGTYSDSDLSANLLTPSGILATNPHSPSLRFDSKQLVPRGRDFALLKPPKPVHGRPFLDVVGQFGLFNVANRHRWEMQLYCTSDFSRRYEPELTHQRMDTRQDRDYELQATDPVEFKGGNSGSPLLAYSEKHAPAVFVAGIVVRGFREPDAMRNCDALLVPEILKGIQSEVLFRFLAPGTNFQCSWPEDDTALLESYLLAVTTKEKGTRKQIADCFENIVSWEATGGALEALDEFIRLLQSNSTALSSQAGDVERYRLESMSIRIATMSHTLMKGGFSRGLVGGVLHTVAAPVNAVARVVAPAGAEAAKTGETSRAESKLHEALARQQHTILALRKEAVSYIDQILQYDESDLRREGAIEVLDAMLSPYVKSSLP